MNRKRYILVVLLALLAMCASAFSQNCTSGTYSTANQPPSACIPFSQNGIFTKPLPNAGAGGPLTHLESNSAAIITTIFSQTSPGLGYSVVAGPNNDLGDNLGEPFFISTCSDPLYLMPLGMPRTVVGSINNPSGHYYHLKPGSRFANKDSHSDQFFLTWDQCTGAVLGGYHCCGGLVQIPPCTGTTQATACPIANDWSGAYVGNYTTDLGYIYAATGGTTVNGGATGALNVPAWALMVRNQEWMEAGANPSGAGINHALYLNAACEDTNDINNIVFPDSGFSAATCASLGLSTTNRPRNGNLFFFDYTDAQIAAMNLPQWQRPIIWALSHYGGYLGDTGAGNGNLEPSRWESWLAYSQAGVTDPLPGWLCPSSCQAGVSKNQVPSGAFQYAMSFFAGIPLVNNAGFQAHMHVADKCVALGMAGQTGGCPPAPGGPIVAFSPSPVAFGVVPVSTTATQTLTLKNTGGSNLTFSAATIAGTNAADFNIVSTTCVSPLGAGNSCTYSLSATPSAAGARTASLTLNDNATGSPHQVTLTATGGVAGVTFAPTSLTFSVTAPASCSAIQTYTVSSTGTSPLNLSSPLVITGTNASDFQHGTTDTCTLPGSYAPGQSCALSIKFCPASGGAKSASAALTTNAAGSPQLEPLTGTGGTSTATLTPSAFNYGSVQVGTSVSHTFTYTNTGTLTLTAIAVSITGATTSYSQTNNCPATLASGIACTIAVAFKPIIPGALNGTLSVNSSGGPLTSALTGNGTAASISLSPTSVSFGSVLVGNFSQVTNVTVTNGGNASATISGVSVVGANPSDFTAGECATTANAFTDNFDTGALSSKWQIDTGTAPGTITGINTGTFSSANVDLSNGMLGLKVTQSGSAPAISVGAEVRSTTAFGFGTYKWSTRMASTATTPYLTGTVPTGQVSSNFILNSSIANPYTEIDAPEVTGNQPNLLQWTTWTTTSARTATTATLANPELAFHLYSFNWTAASVIFSVDGTVSQTHTTNIPTANANPMMNLWGTNSTFGGGVTAGTRWMFVKAFAFTPAGTTTLAAGASCTIPVYFSPQSAGLKLGTLSVADSAAGSPHQASLSGTGTAPVASLTPSPQDFGSQPVGFSTAPINFTWANTGTGPMRWTLSLAGTNPGDFVLGSNSCSNPLPGGQSCLIPVSFKPTTTGARAATLTLVNSSSVSPATAALTGTGVSVAPAVCLSRTSIDFGNIPVGQTSGTFPTTVTNCGNANLVISSITPTGDFNETTGCGTVTPGNTCTINGKFSPVAAGTRTGNFSIASNAASTPDVISLTGFGTQTGATLTSTAAFGSVTLGVTSSPINLTLQNIGNVSLGRTTPTITGTNSADFAFNDSACPTNIAPTATCVISVTFSPIAAGSRTATLTQPFSGGVASVTSALSGTGVAPLPTLSLTPTAIDFGNVQQSSPSASKTIQLQNTSVTDLTLTSVLPGGAFPADVAITSHCGATPVTIAAGGVCTVDVTMTPSTVGNETASVVFTSNAASSPDTTTLSVRGTAIPVPRALLSPASISFSPPSIQTGTVSAASAATLTNIGNANLTVSSVQITGPNQSDFTQTNNCGTVLPGANCAAQVNCAPSSIGSLTANLVFTDNDSTVTQTTTLACTSFAGTPVITLGITKIDFGNQTVGTTSTPLTFIVTNTGSATASGLAISATGDFAVTGNCGATLTQGANCSEQVTFTPVILCGQFDPPSSSTCVSNVHLGQISVVSNTSNSPQTIQLQGTAVPVPPPPGPVTVTLGGVLVVGGNLVVGVQ